MISALKNFAIATIASPPSPTTSGVELDVDTGLGLRMPNTPFQATIAPAPSGVNPYPTPDNAEIVTVTDVTGDTFTMERAQEGSSPRDVQAGDVIAASITAQMLRRLALSLCPLIGDPPEFVASTADMDFRGAADLGPFTAVGTSAGTVQLRQATTTTNIYQLTASGLLIQVGHAQTAQFRADYTLPDGKSIILAIAGAPNLQAGDNFQAFMRLNDNDAGSLSGAYVGVGLEQDTTEYVVQGYSSIDSTGFEYTQRAQHISDLVLLRFAREGLVYRSYVSLNGGVTWNYVDTDTFGSALTNVWIHVLGASASQTRMPAVRVPFIVEGNGDDVYDPW